MKVELPTIPAKPIVCPDCLGRGQINSTTSNDPSERPRDRECPTCEGSGETWKPGDLRVEFYPRVANRPAFYLAFHHEANPGYEGRGLSPSEAIEDLNYWLQEAANATR